MPTTRDPTFRQMSKRAAELHQRLQDTQAEDVVPPAAEGAPAGEGKSGGAPAADDSASSKQSEGPAAKIALRHRPRTRFRVKGDGGAMDGIRQLHEKIQDAISTLQDRTTEVLRGQEQDLLRAFKARMSRVKAELQKERSKGETGSVQWVEKCHKLTNELEWLRETARKLTEENKKIARESKRAKRQLREQGEDREYLIKQMVALRKQNAILQNLAASGGAGSATRSPQSRPSTSALPSVGRTSYGGRPASRMRPSTSQSPSSPNRRFGGRFGATGSPPASQERRYKNVIARLKRQVEAEQVKARRARSMHVASVKAKNELQECLRQCIEEVRLGAAKAEGAGARRAPARGADASPSGGLLNGFGSQERMTVVQKLLSRPRVVYMLYERMFPSKPSQNVTLDTALDEIEAGSRNESSPSDFRPLSNWVETKLSKPGSDAPRGVSAPGLRQSGAKGSPGLDARPGTRASGRS